MQINIPKIGATFGLILCVFTSMALAAVDKTADLVLRNGVVYTVDENKSWAEAVAVKEGKIAFVGSNKQLDAWVGDNTRVVDLKGKMLLPGFQDAHVHPLEGAGALVYFSCTLTRGKDPELWIEYLKECSKKETGLDWVLGIGHDVLDLFASERSPREILDEAIPDKPAAILEYTSRSLWVNSAALKVAGITSETPDPPAGKIIKDPKTGEPNGILLDVAADNVFFAAHQPTKAMQDSRYKAVLKSQQMLAENGITSATAAKVYWREGHMETWQRAEAEGELKTRTQLALWTYPDKEDESQLKALKGLYKNNPSSLLRTSQIKFCADGVLGNNSASMLQPYDHLIHQYANPLGVAYYDEKRMARYIEELEAVGFDIHIHALGDRAVRTSLNAIETAHKASPKVAQQRRTQITHLDVVADSDIPRFPELGVVANFQVNFDSVDPNDPVEGFTVKHLIGERADNLVPVADFNKAGAKIVLSSDWDVSYLSPLVSIQYLVESGGAKDKQRLTELAIKAYTQNPAYAMNQEKESGSIEVGKYADLVVLERNLFETPVKDIRNIQVLMTLLAGKVTYRNTDAE